MKKFVFLLIVLVGGVYGYVSAIMNENPYPVRIEEGMPAEQRALIPQGKQWRPSPLWLPAYLVATVPEKTIEPPKLKAFPGANTEPVHVVGYGMTNVENVGYACSSNSRDRYRSASGGVGVMFGLALAVIVSISCGWVTVRPVQREQ